jgi:hypothetical protein
MRRVLKFVAIGAVSSLMLGYLELRFLDDCRPAQLVHLFHILPLILISMIWPGAGPSEHSSQFALLMYIDFVVVGALIGWLVWYIKAKTNDVA